MEFALPQNIFTSIFIKNLPKDIQNMVEYLPSSLLLKNFSAQDYDIGLVPSCDIILSENNFFVSNKYAISFDGKLSNSNFYFKNNDIKNLHVKGDVSKNEILLTKILFLEKYDIDVELALDIYTSEIQNENLLLVGDENLKRENLEQGISFADYFAELLDYPYVNYLLVAKEKEVLFDFAKHLECLDIRIEDNLELLLNELEIDTDVKKLFIDNFNSVYYELTKNEIDGIKEMVKLMYYYGQIDNIRELNFIG
ncbi:MAG: hypothetical protein JXA68_11160 [Ignavibacteriales bacterium]|nr:hypothetical protein [Ignavibacteriales bacterium]